MDYVVVGFHGESMYYTGKSGFGYVSNSKEAAFPFTKQGAERKAALFNQMQVGMMHWKAVPREA